MRILYLGPEGKIPNWLKSIGEEITQTETAVVAEDVQRFDFLISYGYRHIIKPDVLALFPNRAINLHASYLPWCRGSDVILWSVVDENTPHGVTIHYLDEGIDTGDIIIQGLVPVDDCNDTLRTLYERHHNWLQRLFKENWMSIRDGEFMGNQQTGLGSYHTVADRSKVEHLLHDQWDTPIIYLIGADEGLASFSER